MYYYISLESYSILKAYGYYKKTKIILKCMYKAFIDFLVHDGVEHAGYLSFTILLSIFPFLVFLMALASVLVKSLTSEEVTKDFIMAIIKNIPEEVVAGLMPRIREIISGPPQNLLTLAIVGSIWTASSSVEGMRTILNKAYRVSAPPPYIFRRLLSILQFLIITLVIIIAVTLTTFLPIIYNLLNMELGFLKFAISESLLFICITWLYLMLPNTKQRLKDTVPGSLLVTLTWSFASLMFVKYLKSFRQLNLMYGSLAGIIISLLFFYTLSMLFIYGAEFNYRLKEAKKNKLL